APRRRARGHSGSRATKRGRMLHERRLTALDSSAPLLFIEAIPGSGKRAMLRRWEDGGGSRRGEIRLLFDARLLPAAPASRTRTFWRALRHRLERALPDPPVDDVHREAAVLQGQAQDPRPGAVARLGLLGSVTGGIVAGSDLPRGRELAGQGGTCAATRGAGGTWRARGEVRALVRGQGATLSEDAVAALYNASLGHPGMILPRL